MAGSDDVFNSLVLSVNNAEGYLLLDELVPPSGRALAMQAKEMRVGGRLEGVAMGFTSAVLGHPEERGVVAHRLALPDRLIYVQRRSSRRVKLGPGTVIPISLLRKDPEIRLEGQLNDISRDGVSIALADPDLDIAWMQGEIWDCTFRLTGGVIISTNLEVRHVGRDNTGERLLVGCRLRHLPRPHQRVIDDFVMTLERREAERQRSLKR